MRDFLGRSGLGARYGFNPTWNKPKSVVVSKFITAIEHHLGADTYTKEGALGFHECVDCRGEAPDVQFGHTFWKGADAR